MLYRERRADGEIPPLAIGAVLRGKWEGRSYRILREIGRGANGIVYLAARDRGKVAIKTGEHAGPLALEFERLRWVADEFPEMSLGPQAFELEDIMVAMRPRTVLVMEFVDGLRIDEFIRGRGKAWAPLCLLRLTRVLALVNERGYAFCDLKPANILVQPQSAEVRLVDFGGLTRHGQAVKEFTEMFDRAWWGLGGRKADPAYDTAACALLAVHLTAPMPAPLLDRLAESTPSERLTRLREHVRHAAREDRLAAICATVLDGAITDLRTFQTAVLNLLATQRSSPGDVSPALKRGRKRRRWDATDFGLFFSVAAFVGALLAVLWLGKL